jgi:hypothetical protein
MGLGIVRSDDPEEFSPGQVREQLHGCRERFPGLFPADSQLEPGGGLVLVLEEMETFLLGAGLVPDSVEEVLTLDV